MVDAEDVGGVQPQIDGVVAQEALGVDGAWEEGVLVIFERLKVYPPNHGGGFGLGQGDASVFSGRAQHGAQLTHELFLPPNYPPTNPSGRAPGLN